MKKSILLANLFLPLLAFAQSETSTETVISSPNNRISFIVGPGASILTRKIYDNPIVNQTNNIVVINDASWLKTNLALGIIYTPYITTITRSSVPYLSGSGQFGVRKEVEVVPKGITYGVFINPLAFSKATESQPFSSMIDFGAGIGYRTAGGFLIMGTVEFFSVRQPRQWFIDEYKDQNKTYSIGGAAQKAIDVNDNTIFTNKPVVTFGIKLCYSFDIIKNYVAGAQVIAPTPVAPTPVAPTPVAPTPVVPTPVVPTPAVPTPAAPTPAPRS
jgi:hypothetical protein